jgi:lipopolysaccharide/colanic/teichoic acid biosynthesis glycosyltransferase
MRREESHSQCEGENTRKLIEKVIQLIDTLQDFLGPEGRMVELSNDEGRSPEETDLSLTELLVLFRRTLLQLQETSPTVQQTALDILYSYFVELQGFYDLIFVSKFRNTKSSIPFSPSSIEDYHKRYLPTPQEIEDDPPIREYKSIKYNDLMNVSVSHHFRVVLLDLMPHFMFTAIKEFFQRKPRCCRVLDPEEIDTLEKLREAFVQYPLTEAVKLSVALHRHTMRIIDIIFTHCMLRWARPVFELLVLATWSQTVKDHIVPGIHKPDWQADRLDIEHDEVREVTDKKGVSAKIKMSSAFFMQPRLKFHLERFLIFKIRTMTVGDIVRTTEFGNWMRQNSPDEFLQFFNIALGDMGGVGIRAMPEHEIMETKDTLWLYSALMNFVPCGMTSPGSIVMRKTNYRLTKAEQLFHEIRYFDPRFKGSSRFMTDINIIMRSIAVLNQGRVGEALKKTESFEGKSRGF